MTGHKHHDGGGVEVEKPKRRVGCAAHSHAQCRYCRHFVPNPGDDLEDGDCTHFLASAYGLEGMQKDDGCRSFSYSEAAYA